MSKTEILPLNNDIDEFKNLKNVKQKIKKKFNNLLFDGLSPCPWADYLQCIPHNNASVDSTLKAAEFIMGSEHKFNKEKQTGGGSSSINSFMNVLSSTVELSKTVQKQVDKIYADTQDDRIKAAAAITYISRLFALGLEDNIDNLREYTRSKQDGKEIEDVMYDMVSFIKNTKKDN